MNRIDLAERRFLQIVPTSLARGMGAHQRREILTWLRHDVVAGIESYIDHPDFQAAAAWPLRHLVPRSDTLHRRAVVAVDEALVRAAHALLRLANHDDVARALVEQNPPRERRVETSIVIRGDRPSERTWAPQTIDLLTEPWQQTRDIAGRPWSDLVCPLDYFGPRGGLMLKQRSLDPVTEGEFVVSFNPEFHPVGDFVTRSMIRRVEVWSECLGAFHRLCGLACRQAGEPARAPAEAQFQAWQALQARISELQAGCLTGSSATRRDSCILLTQVYGAFHPAPNLTWLGLPEHLLTHDPAVLRQRILGSRTSEPLERIATALGELRGFPEGGTPTRAALDAAIATGGLVLVNRPRTVYWAGHHVAVDWDRYPKDWEFLHALATKARRAAAVAVAETDLYDQLPGESTMANRLRRLKLHIPPVLSGRIVSADRRAYRLKLARELIHLFESV